MKKFGKAAACMGAAVVGLSASGLAACAQKSGEKDENSGSGEPVFIVGYIPEDEATAGLQYTLSDEGDSFAVSGFKGEGKKRIIVPYMIGELPVTAVGNYAFSDCGELEAVILSRGIECVERSAFSGCENLQTLFLPLGLKEIGAYAFSNCVNLKKLVLPEGIAEISPYAFYGCANLEELVLPDSVTALGTGAFALNLRLKSVTLSTALTEVADYAFSNCIVLEEITLPDGVLAVGASTFEGCDRLKTISLPSSVAAFGDSVFKKCGNLKEIRFGGTADQWNSIIKYDNWKRDTGEFTVVCSDGTLDKNGNVLI